MIHASLIKISRLQKSFKLKCALNNHGKQSFINSFKATALSLYVGTIKDGSLYILIFYHQTIIEQLFQVQKGLPNDVNALSKMAVT